ncbi:MAG: DUF1579 domain-containing protein [bacterium]
MHRVLLAFTLACGLAVAARAAQDMPPMPKPGPEHALFKEDEGTWDATVEMFMPGAPPATSKGIETNTIGCGGLCLITDFKGDMMGQGFHGHGTAAYDSGKKKYVGSWTDSMSTGLAVTEGTYDPTTRTFTGWFEGPDMTGKVTKMRAVTEYKDRNTRVFSMYGPGPDGKEALGMRITYKRKM